MITKIGRYTGIGGNREYTAGFALFSDIGQHRSKHLSFKLLYICRYGRLQHRIQIHISRKTLFWILFELISLTHYCIYHMYVSVSNKILFKLKHLSHIINIKWHRPEVVRRLSEDRLVIVRCLFQKRNVGGPARQGIPTEHLILIGRLSYDVRAITGLFTGHRTNIARVSYGQRTMLVLGPAECRAIVGRCVCVVSCVETRFNVVHGN